VRGETKKVEGIGGEDNEGRSSAGESAMESLKTGRIEEG